MAAANLNETQRTNVKAYYTDIQGICTPTSMAPTLEKSSSTCQFPLLKKSFE